MGPLKPGFWKLCHQLVPLMPKEELIGGTSGVQPSSLQWFQSHSLSQYHSHGVFTRVRHRDICMHVELRWYKHVLLSSPTKTCSCINIAY